MINCDEFTLDHFEIAHCETCSKGYGQMGIVALSCEPCEISKCTSCWFPDFENEYCNECEEHYELVYDDVNEIFNC